MANNASQRTDVDLIPENIKKDINIFGVEWSLEHKQSNIFNENKWGLLSLDIKNMWHVTVVWVEEYNDKIYVFYHNQGINNSAIDIYNKDLSFIETKIMNNGSNSFRPPAIRIWNIYYVQEYNRHRQINLDDFTSKTDTNWMYLPTKYWNFIFRNNNWFNTLQGRTPQKWLISWLSTSLSWYPIWLHKIWEKFAFVTNMWLRTIEFTSENTWNTEKIDRDSNTPFNWNRSSYIEWNFLFLTSTNTPFMQRAINLETKERYKTYFEDYKYNVFRHKLSDGTDISFSWTSYSDIKLKKLFNWRKWR